MGPFVVLFHGGETGGTAYFLDTHGSFTVKAKAVSWSTSNSSEQYDFSGVHFSKDFIQGTCKIYMSGALKFTETFNAFRIALPK
jgi:hypothetical protein